MSRSEAIVVISQLREMIDDWKDLRDDPSLPQHIAPMVFRHIDTARAAIKELQEKYEVTV